MALQKFTSTLMGGFATSAARRTAHVRVALRVNNAIEVFDQINADRSRTKAEKAPMYKELAEKHGRAIKADMEKFGQELWGRTEHYESQVEAVLKGVTMDKAIQSIAGLKMAGVTTEQLIAMGDESPEIAVALARVPQGLSNLSPEVTKPLALKHYPALVELGEANQRDFSAYESLSKVVDRTILTIGLNVDEQVLAERFNPEKLTPTPDPKTMAEQNAFMGKVVDPAFEKATNEQIAEHVSQYGITHAKAQGQLDTRPGVPPKSDSPKPSEK